MNILEKILANKQKEVAERKELYPVKLLEKSIYFNTETVSLKHYLLREDKVGIIAEIKRKSPSNSKINLYADVEKISIGYMQAGASALSVLTDNVFFGGSNDDLITARRFNYCPILRKDFIVDEYQLIEAKSIGADAVLLIAKCLAIGRCEELARFARDLGLEVLLEIQNKEEATAYINENINIVGVNNRNLTDFSTDISVSEELASTLPEELVKVSESGINEPKDIVRLKAAGFNGFLMGTHFMADSSPELACAKFIKEVRSALNNV